MRDTDELAQVGLLLCIMAVVMFSLVFPWSFRTRGSRRLVHLPLVLLILYPAYEATMPPDTNIRIDLIFMWPAVGLVGVCYAVKLLILSRASGLDASTPIGPSEPRPTPKALRKVPPDDLGKVDQRLAHLLPKPKNDGRT